MFYIYIYAQEIIVILIAAKVNGNVCRCSFNLLTSDGFLHGIEISQDPAVFVSSLRTSSNSLTFKRQFPQHIFCLDYHAKLSLLVVVSSSCSVRSGSSTGMVLYYLFHSISSHYL